MKSTDDDVCDPIDIVITGIAYICAETSNAGCSDGTSEGRSDGAGEAEGSREGVTEFAIGEEEG